MKLLWMNLSHYWKRPALIFLLPIFICTMLPLAMIPQKNSSMWLLSVFEITLLSGLTYAHQMEILSRPFSFLLPGHRRVFRRLVLLSNMIWPLLLLVLILLSHSWDMVHRIYVGILTVAMGNLAFWMGIGWTDKNRQPLALTGMMVPLIVFLPMMLDSATVEAVLFNPVFMILVAAVSSIVFFRAWRRLGGISLFQSYCGMIHVGVFTNLSARSLQQMRRQQFAVGVGAEADAFMSRVETFFLNRIEQNKPGPIAPFAYGAMYQTIGSMLLGCLKSTGWNSIWFFALFLFFGYYGKMGDSLILLLYLMALAGFDFRIHSTLMTNRGRTQRYIEAIASLMLAVATLMVIALLGIAATNLVKSYMPPIHLRNLNVVFCPLSWRLPYLFAAAAPIAVIMRLLFLGKPLFTYFGLSLFMASCFFLYFSGGFVYLGQINAGLFLLIVLSTWTAFAIYLYRVCFHKDLGASKCR